jgi:hypothetical protein
MKALLVSVMCLGVGCLEAPETEVGGADACLKKHEQIFVGVPDVSQEKVIVITEMDDLGCEKEVTIRYVAPFQGSGPMGVFVWNPSLPCELNDGCSDPRMSNGGALINPGPDSNH